MTNVNPTRTIVFLALMTVGLMASGQDAINPGDKFKFPEIYNSEPDPGEPISPLEALQALQLPPGFSASLFAAEPEVQNPIAACTDALGRVWIAENYTYAERTQRFDLNLNDRVVVLEDSNGDGIADKRTVFTDQVKMLTGITVGRGGVWLMCPPQLLFIPDADGDLVPDGPPQLKLDGFTVARENYHNFANGLSWGPDNWLYGRCGASCAGEVGLPGSKDEDRVPLRGGMWRFHPERRVYETLTHGTTNPWGHDWNALGELFFINTVNGHLWNAIPGAHFVRSHTLDANPHIYELIDMHADHWHFDTGKSWTASRDGAANDYGGGHAHIGMMIYQEDRWPAEYRGALMTVNMHGRRINTDMLSRVGAGYVGKHGADFLVSSDIWFRGMDIVPLHDGNALLIDWSDTGECHDSTGVHRTSGRIFKIAYTTAGEDRSNPLANASLRNSPLKLAELQATGSTWASRRARDLLASNPEQKSETNQAVDFLQDLLKDPTQPIELRLRGLWSLNAMGMISTDELQNLLLDESESIRCWAIRLLADDWRIDMSDGRRPTLQTSEPAPEIVEQFVAMATKDVSPAVRLSLASVLQRLPHSHRRKLAIALVGHVEDAKDHDLPFMVWFGITPLGEGKTVASKTTHAPEGGANRGGHLDDLLEILDACQWPLTRRLIARRVADQSKLAPVPFDRLIEVSLKKDLDFQSDVVLGLGQALAGWRKANEPQGWRALKENLRDASNQEVQASLKNLSILFGDGVTTRELMRVAADGKAALELRKSALRALVESRADGIRELCLKLLNERFLNSTAAAGLASETDAEIGEALVNAYRRFHPSERSQVVSILASRPAWAKSLLSAVQMQKIDREEISAFQARQIASLNDPDLDALLQQVWGQVRSSSAEKKAFIDTLRSRLASNDLAKADKIKGRATFRQSCSGCHKLFGEGGAIGPDLTGAQRSNLDYLLENIVDPSAVVTKQFRATVILLEDDRVLTGLVTSQTDNVVTLATQNETYQLATEEIVEMKQSSASTMPDGLLDQLKPEQIRDLFAYLQSVEQVPLE